MSVSGGRAHLYRWPCRLIGWPRVGVSAELRSGGTRPSSDETGTPAGHRFASASTFIELRPTMARRSQDGGDLLESGRLATTPRGRIGLIVAGSLAAGLVAALVLVAAPFIAAQENVLTGAVLLGFAFGWALLAVLSVRFTDQPQRWAAAPAVFMGVAGLALLSGSAARARSARLGVAAGAVRACRLDVPAGPAAVA